MPFGLFVGGNNHFQTIIFGCALLQDETEESFVWLFETWLDAMYGKSPVSIITDQDTAIANAIKRVFPTTTHRLNVVRSCMHSLILLCIVVQHYENLF
jgi:MULE transposase domain